MELPLLLKSEIEKSVGNYKTSELNKQSQLITNKYKNESGKGKRLVTSKMEALVYSIVRMPATYGAIYSTLEKVFDYFDEEITSVLDIGAGTGAGEWALLNFISSADFTCLEREKEMMHQGKKLMENHEILKNVNWILEDVTSFKGNQKADLVLASYSLNEMEETERLKLVDKLWQCTNKLLIIIEPGTIAGYQGLMSMRDSLIKAGGHLIAPCPHEQSCPLEKDNWCHFTVRVSRSRLHKSVKGVDVPYEDEKFSFIAFSKNETKSCQNRVLRHPIKEAGKITLTLCNDSGIEVKTVLKRNKAEFKIARKLDSGDVF